MTKKFELNNLISQDAPPSPAAEVGQGAPKAAPKPAAPPAKVSAPEPKSLPSKRLSLALDGETYRTLRLHAIETDQTHQDIMAAAVNAYLRKHAGK